MIACDGVCELVILQMQKSPGTALRPLPATSCQRKLKGANSTTSRALQELKILSQPTIYCEALVLTLMTKTLKRKYQSHCHLIFLCFIFRLWGGHRSHFHFIFSDFDFEKGKAGWQLIIWLNSHLPHPSSHSGILIKKSVDKGFSRSVNI